MYIVAEIGVNFFDVAKKYNISPIDACKLMIHDAKDNGADAVKFQAYKADTLVSKNSPAYWDTTLEPTTTQYELFTKHDRFEQHDFEFLSSYCREVGIEFICTPFDLHSVEYLDGMVNVYKISSSDITNKQLLQAVGRKNKKVLLSTGASTIEEIRDAINVLHDTGNRDIVIMHCVLSYPTSDEDANLNMITSIKSHFPGHQIGYSDHTRPDSHMLILSTAYALGATYIEKHFTLDKQLVGNDHYHSMDASDLKIFKTNTTQIDKVTGNMDKSVLDCEGVSRVQARRAIYARRPIPRGSVLTAEDVICKRPCVGICAMKIDEVIGRVTSDDIEEDAVITYNNIK